MAPGLRIPFYGDVIHKLLSEHLVFFRINRDENLELAQNLV